MPIDRRVRRTRETLHHALMSLIPKKSYAAITVRDICDAANVGKSTFYAHYTGKDDLKRNGLEQFRASLAAECRAAMAAGSADGPFGFGLPLFRHARDHLHLYRATVGRGETAALGTIRRVLSDLVREELAAVAGKTGSGHSAAAVPRELAVQYVVGAYMAVLTWWLDNGAKLPPDQIDSMVRRMAAGGIVTLPGAGGERGRSAGH